MTNEEMQKRAAKAREKKYGGKKGLSKAMSKQGAKGAAIRWGKLPVIKVDEL